MHKVLHNLITKSLVGKQTLQNSFMSAKATNTVYNTFELTDFNMLKIQHQCTLGIPGAGNKGAGGGTNPRQFSPPWQLSPLRHFSPPWQLSPQF